MRIQKMLGLVGIAAMTMAANVANADSFVWQDLGANDNWNTTGNWLNLNTFATNDYPNDTSDIVYIPAGETPIVNVSSIAVARLFVSPGAAVTVSQSGFTIHEAALIEGEMDFDATMTLSSADLEVATTGVVRFNFNGNATLTSSSILVRGEMRLQGSADLVGTSATLILDTNAVLHVDSGTSSIDAGIAISDDATSRVVVDTGDTLELNEDYAFNGAYDLSPSLTGVINVATAGKTVSFGRYCKGGHTIPCSGFAGATGAAAAWATSAGCENSSFCPF